MSNITRFSGQVNKGWGYEYIFATNELYCGKILHFYKAGNKFSMHFHANKDETWYIISGSFILKIIDPITANTRESILNKGDSIRIYPLTIHQLEAIEDNSELIEVSSPDCVEDNYRVSPGNSQNV